MSLIATKYPFIGTIESRVGGREENQDYACYTDTPLGLLLVVCDGMGGGPGGRTASHTAVDIMLNTLEDVSPRTLPSDALRFAIEKANERLYNLSLENAELRGMGTTVVAMLINENKATVAHVGDSRLYQLRRGRVVFRTADHSQVAELVRAGHLTEEEARNHPRSNIITRALGIRPTIEIEIDQVDFCAQDRFVLCSDGVWGMMPQSLLIKRLTRPMGIMELAELTVTEIDRMGNDNGGGHDNLTLALLDSQCSSAPKTEVAAKIPQNTESQEFSVHIINQTASAPLRGGWSYKHSFWLLLIVALIGIGYFVWWMNRQRAPMVPFVQQTTTHHPIIIPPKGEGSSDTISADNTSSVRHRTTRLNVNNAKRSIENVETDQDSRALSVTKKVDSVILQLEELKMIQGKDRDEGRMKKRRYIKGIQNRLQSIPLQDETQISSRNQAAKLLDSPKACACDKKGKSTKESNEYIEKVVIRKVRAINRP